jgi:ArsR family transcriptional regulator, zinc-responsive transcriptional repressor
MAKQIHLLDYEAMGHAAECLKTLAHPVRLRMVQLLMQDRFTVGALAVACEVLPHVASEHLRLMKQCGLLIRKREGRQVFYHIGDDHLRSIMGCIRHRFGEGAVVDATRFSAAAG